VRPLKVHPERGSGRHVPHRISAPVPGQQHGEWKDGDSLFLTCQAWRQLGEHIAESLEKGMRAIITGRLRQRSYETREGEKRTVYEVQVDEAGPALSKATAKVTMAFRRNGRGQGAAADEGAAGWPAGEPPF
jgi:single-strand DNA-binding protein